MRVLSECGKGARALSGALSQPPLFELTRVFLKGEVRVPQSLPLLKARQKRHWAEVNESGG